MSSSTVTAGFIDLATYDELERYLYGGGDSFTYFVKKHRKSTWFTQVITPLTLQGQPNFGADSVRATISRQADYLTSCFVRVLIPQITFTANGANPNLRLRWTKNLMHALVYSAISAFNGLVTFEVTDYIMDMWSQFTVVGGKRNGYDNMIGNIGPLIDGVANGGILPSVYLNLPMPWWFGVDSGLALPVAALPYNDMTLEFKLRPILELLMVDDLGVVAPGAQQSRAPLEAEIATGNPQLTQFKVWANYVLVSTDERSRMGATPRDLVISQWQNNQSGKEMNADSTQTCQLLFAHGVQVILFAAKNTTYAGQHGNYTAASPVPGAAAVNYFPSNAADPISTASLFYENTAKYDAMGADFYSLVQPWYHAPAIPGETGHHLISYSLDVMSNDPKGSTNFGKLTNVSMQIVPSPLALQGIAGAGAVGSGASYVQKFKIYIVAKSYNIVRISGGALGFPIL